MTYKINEEEIAIKVEFGRLADHAKSRPNEHQLSHVTENFISKKYTLLQATSFCSYWRDNHTTFPVWAKVRQWINENFKAQNQQEAFDACEKCRGEGLRIVMKKTELKNPVDSECEIVIRCDCSSGEQHIGHVGDGSNIEGGWISYKDGLEDRLKIFMPKELPNCVDENNSIGSILGAMVKNGYFKGI